MPKQLQLKFDPNQDYQLDAIAERRRPLSRASAAAPPSSPWATRPCPTCRPTRAWPRRWLYDNSLAVQERNEHPHGRLQPDLDVDEGVMLEGVGIDTWRYPHFTVEMETGTGKTYVYLRTIHELRQRYGFRKFIDRRAQHRHLRGRDQELADHARATSARSTATRPST